MRSWTKEKNNEVKQKEDTQKRQWRKEVEETWDGEKKKEWRNERKEKGEKSKKGWTKGWKEKVNKEKVMIENKEKCWKKTSETKRDGTETKNEDFLAEFFVVLSEEREELIQQIKNSGKI